MSEGWICLHRKITEWEWYDDANTFRVFIHCLIRANHKDSQWRGVNLKKGQFISSRAKLSTELALTEQKLRTALDKLKTTNEVTSEGTSQHTVFTVVNYDKYQSTNQQSNQANNQRITSKQPADNQPITTDNNDNNDNKEEIYVDQEQKPAKPNGKHNNKILFEQITEIYNELLGGTLPRVADMSEPRQRALKARCSKKIGTRDTGSPEFWRGYFGYVADKCPFLVGENKDGWTANFDWLIKEANFLKVIEGSYERQEKPNASH